MSSLLWLKKENFRKEIRRQNIEEILKKKRIQPLQHSQNVNIDELIFKIKNLENCDQLLNLFCDLDHQPLIINELLHFLNNVQQLESLKIGLRCLGNQIYHYNDFENQEQYCYETLQKLFQIDDFEIKQLVLRCVGNFIHDQQGYVIQIQTDFFQEQYLKGFTEEYSFIINVLSSYCKLDLMIKSVQFLSQILQICENDDAFEATIEIFSNCSSLEADDLIDSDFMVPLIKIIQYSQNNNRAFNVIIKVLDKVNDFNKVSLFIRGIDCLIKYYLDHIDLQKKDQGFSLILQFLGRQEENDQQNLLISAIYQLYEDNTLFQLLIQDCNPQKLLIICNSIQNGNIEIFIEFLHLNIIEKIFIPYLLSQDRDTIAVIVETIDQLFQRDELCLSKFNYIIKAFNTEQFKQAIECNYYNSNMKIEDVHIFDSILQILGEQN